MRFSKVQAAHLGAAFFLPSKPIKAVFALFEATVFRLTCSQQEFYLLPFPTAKVYQKSRVRSLSSYHFLSPYSIYSQPYLSSIFPQHYPQHSSFSHIQEKTSEEDTKKEDILRRRLDIYTASSEEFSTPNSSLKSEATPSSSSSALLRRNPWTHSTSGRAYSSTAEKREREARVSDEADDENYDDDDDDADEPSEFEDEYDVEDEQRIEDSDDNVEEEEVVVEPSVKKKKFTPPKTKLPDQEGRCLNEKITARFVRLVGEDGKSHKVVSRHEALTLAKAKNMDLVQVDITSEPPVCKIFDFHKEEYRQAQILKDRKKKKGAMAHLGEVKEIRFTAKTELKDLKMKVEKAEGFTDRGYRVKFVAMFKAKADDEKKRLEEEKIIDSVCSMVKNFAIIEQGPRVESRQAWVILRHVKFAKNLSTKHKNQTAKSIEQKEQSQELHVMMDRLSKQAKAG